MEQSEIENIFKKQQTKLDEITHLLSNIEINEDFELPMVIENLKQIAENTAPKEQSINENTIAFDERFADRGVIRIVVNGETNSYILRNNQAKCWVWSAEPTLHNETFDVCEDAIFSHFYNGNLKRIPYCDK